MKKIIFIPARPQLLRLLLAGGILFFCTTKSFAVIDSLNQFNFDKAITIELGGSAGLYSINYESPWLRSARLCYRAGVMLFKEDNRWQICFPVMLEKILGEDNSKLILGAGMVGTLAYYNYNRFASYIRGIACVGWHYQKKDKRFFFRVCYTPFISFLYDWQYEHYAGVTFGYKLIP